MHREEVLSGASVRITQVSIIFANLAQAHDLGVWPMNSLFKGQGTGVGRLVFAEQPEVTANCVVPSRCFNHAMCTSQPLRATCQRGPVDRGIEGRLS